MFVLDTKWQQNTDISSLTGSFKLFSNSWFIDEYYFNLIYDIIYIS